VSAVSSNPNQDAAAQRYERYALFYDPDHTSRLGVEAMGLVERGIDPLFASDLDEAHLLSLQESGRVGALIVSGSLPLERLDVLLDRVSPQLWAGPAAVVIVGAPPDRGELRALQDRGICWVLREPYDAAELRFAVAAALATEDKLDPRSGLRVPINVPVTVRHGDASRQGMVRNLSVGGAYVALADPEPPGTLLDLATQLGEHAFEVQASVVYRQAPGAAGRAVGEAGMGLSFRAPDEEQRRRLEAFIAERVRSFRL
jgi:hypothetical protein